MTNIVPNIAALLAPIFSILLLSSCSTDVKAPFALQQSIAYHDPSTEWATFDDTLRVIAKRPGGEVRYSTMYIDVARNIFSIEDSTASHVISYQWAGDSCRIWLNGSADFTAAQRDSLQLTCDRLLVLKDYYTFLYGLPMKLADRGVNLIDTLHHQTFKGKNYVVLQALFSAANAKHVWYFYLHPDTYRMEAYQFFETDHNGSILPETGQYVLLDGEFFVGGMNLPKERTWFTNKNDTFLGKDILVHP